MIIFFRVVTHRPSFSISTSGTSFRLPERARVEATVSRAFRRCFVDGSFSWSLAIHQLNSSFLSFSNLQIRHRRGEMLPSGTEGLAVSGQIEYQADSESLTHGEPAFGGPERTFHLLWTLLVPFQSALNGQCRMNGGTLISLTNFLSLPSDPIAMAVVQRLT